MIIYVIDVLAAIFVVAGFYLAFRQKPLTAMRVRVRSLLDRSASSRVVDVEGPPSEEMASVLRIAGVMIMAFSFTVGAFANLIVYYSAASG